MQINNNIYEEKSKNLVKVINEILKEKDEYIVELNNKIKEKDKEIERLTVELSNNESNIEYWQEIAEGAEEKCYDTQCRVIEVIVPRIKPPSTVKIIDQDECEIIKIEDGESYIDTVENILNKMLKDIENKD